MFTVRPAGTRGIDSHERSTGALVSDEKNRLEIVCRHDDGVPTVVWMTPRGTAHILSEDEYQDFMKMRKEWQRGRS